jgi:hypothetical protein
MNMRQRNSAKPKLQVYVSQEVADRLSDGICPACADAMREERAAALEERCRIHRVRYVDDLPVSVLQEMRAERGRC